MTLVMASTHTLNIQAVFQSKLGGAEFQSQASKKSRPKCFIWKTKMNQLKNVWSSCERELRKTASKVLPGCTFFFSLSEECFKPHCKRCRTSREDERLRPIRSGGWLRPGWTLVNLLLLSTSPSGNQSEPSAVSGGFTQCARELRACVNGLTMVHIHLLCVGIHQHLVQYLLTK